MLSSQQKKYVKASVMLGLVVVIGMSLFEMCRSSSTSSNAPMNQNMANMLMRPSMEPANSVTGQKQLSTDIWSCPSEQLDKLDDCDADDTPNFGENWVGYIKSQ